MRWMLVAAFAAAGCSTPKQAIIGGSVTLAISAAMFGHAALSQPTNQADGFGVGVEYLVSVPAAVVGSILLVSGIAAAIKNE